MGKREKRLSVGASLATKAQLKLFDSKVMSMSEGGVRIT